MWLTKTVSGKLVDGFKRPTLVKSLGLSALGGQSKIYRCFYRSSDHCECMAIYGHVWPLSIYIYIYISPQKVYKLASRGFFTVLPAKPCSSETLQNMSDTGIQAMFGAPLPVTFQESIVSDGMNARMHSRYMPHGARGPIQ